MKKNIFLSVIIILFLYSASVFAKDPAGSEDPRHDELRAVMVDLQDALDSKDIEKIKSHLSPNVNVVLQDAEVADGIEAVDALYKRLFVGNAAILNLKSYSSRAQADVLSEIYENTAVVYGTITDSLSFSDWRGDIQVTSRWTATLLKEDGKWKIISLQLGANLFDNPLLNAATKSIKYFGLGGLVIGLIVGFFTAKIYLKKKLSTNAQL
ncbi:MAG: nuclear transport factor 2 family protein [bacterium]|nr:nuclear transport factor 2 family protein [bacterium]